MRVPQVDDIDDELWVDILEQVVALVVLVHVSLDIRRLLQEEIALHRGRLGPVNLSLADECLPWRRILHNFNRLAVVQANIAFGLPLALILVEAVEVTRGIVEEDALRSQIIEDFRRFVLIYRGQ